MIRLTKRKSVICFSPSLGDCCQVVSQRSSSPSRSPSWPWLAWESISKCRDLDLNGSLKQSQENKSRGCFSEAQWEASSPPHSPSFWLSQNSFAPKIMNRIPLFFVSRNVICGDQVWFLSHPCRANGFNAIYGDSIALCFSFSCSWDLIKRFLFMLWRWFQNLFSFYFPAKVNFFQCCSCGLLTQLVK